MMMTTTTTMKYTNTCQEQQLLIRDQSLFKTCIFFFLLLYVFSGINYIVLTALGLLTYSIILSEKTMFGLKTWKGLSAVGRTILPTTIEDMIRLHAVTIVPFRSRKNNLNYDHSNRQLQIRIRIRIQEKQQSRTRRHMKKDNHADRFCL